MGRVESGIVSESKAAEAWIQGVPCKPLAGPNVKSCLYPENKAATAVSTAGSQSRFTDEGINLSLCFGATLSSQYAFQEGSSNVPASASRVSPSVKEVVHLSSGICESNKIGLKSEGGLHWQSSSGNAQKPELLVSEACQKRFILFDQSGSKEKVIFHPAMMHEVSNLLHHKPNSLGDLLNHLQSASVRAVGQLKETMVSSLPEVDIAAWETRLGCHRWYWPSGSGTLTGEMSEQGDPSPLLKVVAEAGRGSGNEVYLYDSASSNEDTEDLEALLDSDDEMSTGHSPSDSTWNNAVTVSDNDSTAHSHANANSSKKRKVTICCNEDDVDSSTATSGNVQPEGFKYINTRFGSFDSAMLQQGLNSGYSERDPAAFHFSLPWNMIFESSDTKPKQNYNPESDQQGPAKRSRKEKIKDTFQLLRDIIPGGDDRDTAFVLGETIRYVKSLQVEIQTLEAKKLT